MESVMAYCWKEEYAVHDVDDDVLAWFDELDEAMEYASGQATAVKIVRMRHYSTEYDDVWSTEDSPVEDDE